MNHIYRSIWSEALATWIAVSENSKGKSKSSSACNKVLATTLLLCSASSWALPTGEQIVAGQVNVATPNAGQMQINQASQQAIINWQGFSIAPSESVNILQPNASAALLNRVVGMDASVIQGQLHANGLVYLINPNGVLFSNTAQVDVGGLIASTHSLNNADFLNGHFHFTQDYSHGTVDNQGYIRSADGGVVALIGTQVSNNGTIETPQGTTILAAGKTVDLDFKGNGLVEVKVPEAALNAQVENKGVIFADGGRVVLTAKAAGDLVGTVLNSAGVIRAQSLVSRNGEIILDGGENGLTQVSGTLNTNGQQAGGTISVTGKNVNINNTANLTAQALQSGTAGTIKILGDMHNGTLRVAGNLNASAPVAGNGGFIETSAAHVTIADSATVSTLARNGSSGTWLIDPADFTIAASGGDMTGAAVSSALAGGNFTIQSTSGSTAANGDVNLNDVVNWSVHKLTLNAQRNININADLNGSGTAQLALQYGQASLNGGTNDNYFINNGAKINLAAGANFSTQKGSDIANLKNYTVITSLGAAGSVTTTDLQGINGDRTLNYVLGADIDASATSGWNPNGTRNEGFLPISGYSALFDGLGHTITGLTINRSTTDNIGLFGLAGANVAIRNVGIVGGSIIGQNQVGELLGASGYNTLISNVYATGNVTGVNNVGGLVGISRNSIDNSYASGNVIGSGYNIGGLVGDNYGSIINNSHATGNVTGASSVGGLAGDNYLGATINNTYATGTVTGTSNVGGLVGNNASASGTTASGGIISNSHATGNVTGTTSVGGLVGLNSNGSIPANIQNTYATGSVSGNTNVGGLIGLNDGYLSDSYAAGNVIGSHEVGGLVGLNGGRVSNSHYNIDTTLINGNPLLGVGGLYNAQYQDWITHNKTLNIANYFTFNSPAANGSLIYNINNLQDMKNLLGFADTPLIVSSDIPTYTFRLTNNIDLSSAPDFFIPHLTVEFDGANHSISNLNINQPFNSKIGMFGQGITVKNLGLTNVNVRGYDYVGGLGGDFGAWNSSVTNSYVTGTVNGHDLVGGLVGFIAYSSAANQGTGNSYSTADVTGNSSVGGLVGDVTGGNIVNSYATGNVSSNDKGGGLVGVNAGTIRNSYASGNVSGGSSLGGLAGHNSGTIENSFWDTTKNPSLNSIGAGNISGVTSKTSAEMMQSATFTNAGWSISNSGGSSSAIWRIYEGHTAPLLRSFLTPLTITANNINKTYDRVIVNALNNPTYSIAGATTSGHLLNTTNPYDSAINVGTYTATGLYSDQQGYDIATTGTLIIAPTLLTVLNAAIIGSPSRAYDGTDIATLAHSNYQFTGFIGGEGARITQMQGRYNSKDVAFANSITVTLTPSDFLADTGTLLSNYVLPTSASGAGSITPLTLTAAIIGSPSKTYDGNSIATLNNGNYQLSGFISGESANVTQSVGSYNSKDVTTANTINASLAANQFSANTGTLLSNYILPTSATGAGYITPASLIITANNANKIYDNSPYFGGNGVSYQTFAANEDSSVLTGLLTYGGNSQGALNNGSYQITPGGLSSTNYSISYQDGTLNIGNISSPATETSHEAINNNIAGLVTAVSSNTQNNSQQQSTSSGSTSSSSSNSNNAAFNSATASDSSSATASTPTHFSSPTVYDVSDDNVTNSTGNSTSSNESNSSGSNSSNSENSTSHANTTAKNDSSERLTTNTSSNNALPPNALSGQAQVQQLIQPTLQIKNSAGRVLHLEMSANKQFLSLLLEDGSVRVWDFQRGIQRQIDISNIKHSLTDIGGVNDSGDLLSIASKAGIGAYDVISSVADMALTEKDIHHFVSSNDGALLLVNTGMNNLRLWDKHQNKQRWQTSYQRGEINSLAMTNNRRYAAVLSHQPGSYLLPANLQLKRLTDAVDIIDLRNGKVIKSLPNLGEQVIYMQFKDNDTLQLGLTSGEMRDWSLATGQQKTIAAFGEAITAVDTANQTYSYLLQNGTVRVGDGQGQVQFSIQNKENPVRYAMLLADGKKLLTVMSSGDLALWDVASGKKMLRLFSTQQGWTVMDAFGRFDGSEEALENFSWLANEEDIPLDNFSENYYEPGLLANVLQNQDYLNSNPNVIKQGISLPPKVNLQLAEQQRKGDNVTLQLDVYDRGGGINKINVYHNGKILADENLVAVQPNQTDTETGHQTLTVNITPRAGKNTLKVIASNTMGIENNSAELSFDGKSKAYSSSVRLFTVGIDQYSDKNLNLSYSVADANAIGTAIKQGSKITSSKSLLNERATKPKILAELKELSQGAEQDVLVIYFAGHGIAIGKEWYFLPYETKLQPTLKKIAATGITATELSDIFKNSKIQHILLMVDSCYSGAGMDAFSKLENGQRYFTRQLSRSLGITVLTATTKNQQAAELKSLGHGLFTYLMTQEIQQKDTGEPVTAHSIAENIVKTLPIFSKKTIGLSQEPAAYTHGSDFVLTDVLKKTK